MTQATDDNRQQAGNRPESRLPPPRLGLSGKLLILTILFVMIAEVLIYVPSIANFRLNWFRDRLNAAYTAALVLEATPNVPDPLARQVLDSIGARAVAMKMGQQRRLLMAGDMPPAVDHEIDMRNVAWHRAIIDAFVTLALDRQRSHPRDRTCAHGRRVRRGDPGRKAPARRHAGVLGQHPAAVAGHFRHHGDAGVL